MERNSFLWQVKYVIVAMSCFVVINGISDTNIMAFQEQPASIENKCAFLLRQGQSSGKGARLAVLGSPPARPSHTGDRDHSSNSPLAWDPRA